MADALCLFGHQTLEFAIINHVLVCMRVCLVGPWPSLKSILHL